MRTPRDFVRVPPSVHEEEDPSSDLRVRLARPRLADPTRRLPASTSELLEEELLLPLLLLVSELLLATDSSSEPLLLLSLGIVSARGVAHHSSTAHVSVWHY